MSRGTNKKGPNRNFNHADKQVRCAVCGATKGKRHMTLVDDKRICKSHHIPD